MLLTIEKASIFKSFQEVCTSLFYILANRFLNSHGDVGTMTTKREGSVCVVYLLGDKTTLFVVNDRSTSLKLFEAIFILECFSCRSLR